MLEKRIAQFEKMRAEREILELAEKKIALLSMTATDGRPLHPTAGSIFPRDYLKARLEFQEAAGEKNLAFFDRAWRGQVGKFAFLTGANRPKSMLVRQANTRSVSKLAFFGVFIVFLIVFLIGG